MLENLTQWSLVRYIGSLISPEVLENQLGKMMELYQNNSFRGEAKHLFIWCAVIIVVSTIIDQVFYWLRPEQRVRLENYLSQMKKFKNIFIDKIRVMFKK